MIKISHALMVTILSLVLLTGYFDNMLDTTQERIFELEKKLEENMRIHRLNGHYHIPGLVLGKCE